MQSLSFLEKTHAAVIFSVIPFWGLFKGAFLTLCSVPATGVAMKLYDLAAAPFFSPGGALSSQSLAAPSESRHSSGPMIKCLVKGSSGLPADGSLYLLIEETVLGADQSEGRRFKTACATGGSWTEDIYVPKSEGSTLLLFTVMAKQQFGSDTVVGSAEVSLVEKPYSSELAVIALTGGECGKLIVDVAVEA